MATRELSPQDFQTLLEFSKNLARSAGVIIREGAKAILNQDQGNVDEKKNSVDLVTQWDVKVEEHVKSEIKKSWPGFELSVFEILYFSSFESHLLLFFCFVAALAKRRFLLTRNNPHVALPMRRHFVLTL